MKRMLYLLLVMSFAGCFATTDRHGNTRFSMILPDVLPPMEVVEPGVSVVTDLDQEVFYSGGYYWARQDDTWFRSRSHRSGWEGVERREVPSTIVAFTPGRYVRHHPEHHVELDGRGEGAEQDHD